MSSLPRLACDVAIIGAGTAGLAAECSAREQGAATLLIDDRFAGTTCATVGCMPSKLLIAAADAAEAVRRASIFGLKTGEPCVDSAAVLQRVRRERDVFVAATKKEAFDKLPAGIMVRAYARFATPTMLALNDGRTVTAKAIVIATGARASIPAMFASVEDRVLTNETIFDLAELPASVAVIGAGPLGLELAQALARLGVETMLFDNGQIIAGLRDTEVAASLRDIIERDLPIRLGVELEVRPDGEGVSLSWSGPQAGAKRFERLLVAAGRPPQLAELDLEKIGVQLDDHGTPRFNRDTLQCDDFPIFLAGDADADRPVLHEASSEGTIAGRNAALFPNVMPGRRSVPFSLMFTDPPLAIIGTATNDTDAVIGTASYEDQGRAKVMARNAGVIRLYADKDEGRLVGAAMAGPGVDHTAHLIAWAIENRQTAHDLLAMPIYHPTVEEGLKPALREICRQLDV
jgi:dihydrolipoamide dehydrogenase